ncbi:hypothetical protein [Nocardioides sp. R-C-SC26]|uniref:hypothetical protein n=1 Tax=Nocardioides sp. R-C-SC26 TaxID=2870414 RepID=UPI001E563CAD|nr:hypothetical protein [Nocardioides sp. R-C-SC26]
MTRAAEPEWDDATRDLALAHDSVNLCSACGGPAYLCQDPDLEFDWHAPPPTRCHRLTALREAQKGIDSETNPHPDALVWSTRLRAKEV